MKKNILLLCFVLSLISCQKEQKKETSTIPKTNDSTEVVISETKVIIDTTFSDANTMEDYCIALDYLKEEYTKKLNESNSKERNNQLYEAYYIIRNKYIENITRLDDSLLIHYAEQYSEDQDNYVLDANYTRVANQLKKVAVEFWYVGEGFTEFRSIPSHYPTMFKGKVTPDYQDFLEQIAHEDLELYSSDGGFMIQFEEVGKRVAYWETFLSKHPKSSLKENAEGAYNNYLKDFIFGLENTQTYNENEGQIDPEYQEVFDAYIKKYPNFKSTKKIQEFQKLVAQKASVDEIHKTLKLKYKFFNE